MALAEVNILRWGSIGVYIICCPLLNDRDGVWLKWWQVTLFSMNVFMCGI